MSKREAEGLAGRWAQRKQRVAEEAAREQAEQQVLAEQAQTPAEKPLTDADMPPLDSLDESSDYSGFLSPEVSEELRRLALRKLFSGASFNVCDGLDDYAEDFTYFEPLGDIVTWDMKAQQRREAERAAAQAQRSESQTLAETDAELPSDEAIAAADDVEPTAPVENQKPQPSEPANSSEQLASAENPESTEASSGDPACPNT
jgi:hypothetical protein